MANYERKTKPTFTSILAVSGVMVAGAAAVAAPSASGAEPTTTVFVSDLTPVSSTNGWGPFEKDRSNGDLAAGDGRVLSLDGRTFAKGLGVHSTSDVRYTVPAGCTRFDAVIGVDDEVSVQGTVVFQVFRGTSKAFDSGLRTWRSRA